MAREYELTFTIDPRDAERLVAHPLIRPALRERQVDRLVSTYYDTPDLTLQRHRFGLRTRTARNRITHTLKQTGGSLVDRGEWEHTDASPRPSLAWLARTPAAPLLANGAAARLGPRFTVDVTRTTLPMRHKKAHIEAALDQGAIRSAGLSLPLSEFELEVKQGRAEAALDLARTLARDLPLSLSLASKAERGYAVSDLTWGRPDEAIRPALTKRMTIAEAYEAVMQACLHTFLKNAALVESAASGEAVHKARIALRHLRATCDLFAPALRRKRTKRLLHDIKWLARRFGAARDADVQKASTFDAAAAADVVGAVPLAALMEAERAAAHTRLRTALASPRARVLVVDLLAASSGGVRRRHRDTRFRGFVRAALERRRKALRRQARGLAKQMPRELHEVRKAAKMLRYDLDLFAAVPKLGKGKRAERLRKRLGTLQKRLGRVNDDEALRRRLRSVSKGRHTGAKALSAAEFGMVATAAAQLSPGKAAHRGDVRKAAKAARGL